MAKSKEKVFCNCETLYNMYFIFNLLTICLYIIAIYAFIIKLLSGTGYIKIKYEGHDNDLTLHNAWGGMHMLKRKSKWKICIGIFLVVLILYTVFTYFLVSVCLVPSFMNKLEAFQKITEKSYAQQVQSSDIKKNRKVVLSESKQWSQNAEKQKITATTLDGYTLVAQEFFPKEGCEDTNKWVILLHGYTGWKEEMYQFGYWYYNQGFHVLVPDLRAQGESEGDFIGMGWTDHIDCEQWIQYILSQTPDAQIVLHGQSMGAATALMMSGDQASSDHVVAVISDCAYTDAYTMFEDKIGEWFGLPAFPLEDSACIMLQLRGGYNLKDASAINAVKQSDIPTLFIHGDKDAMIDVAMAYELYDSATCDKELLIIEDAGHAQAQDKNPELYYATVSSFIGNYIIE